MFSLRDSTDYDNAMSEPSSPRIPVYSKYSGKQTSEVKFITINDPNNSFIKRLDTFELGPLTKILPKETFMLSSKDISGIILLQILLSRAHQRRKTQ